MKYQHLATLDYQTDGTAWFSVCLVRDDLGAFFIEASGSGDPYLGDAQFHKDRWPLVEARPHVSDRVWKVAMDEVARLQGGASQKAT